MVTYYFTINGKVTLIDEYRDGCWINVINPTEEEISSVTELLGVENDYIRAALDEEETSRIESEDGNTLVIIDVPFAKKESDGSLVYITMPMGIILTEKAIATVCLVENSVVRDFSDGLIKNVQTSLKTRFLLHILLKVASKFLQYLKQIDKLSNYIEKQLHASMKNKELIQLLGLEKSLVFFSTSLKANEVTIEKVLRGRNIKLYEDDQDLLEDVLIEIKQAIEMSNIYSSILSGTMDAFASMISNNLNIVMKVLTVLTILMAIPTMIFSFYGMNVSGLPFAGNWLIPFGIGVVVTAVAAFVLLKKKMF